MDPDTYTLRCRSQAGSMTIGTSDVQKFEPLEFDRPETFNSGRLQGLTGLEFEGLEASRLRVGGPNDENCLHPYLHSCQNCVLPAHHSYALVNVHDARRVLSGLDSGLRANFTAYVSGSRWSMLSSKTARGSSAMPVELRRSLVWH